MTEELLVVGEVRAYRTDRLKANLAGHLIERFPIVFLDRLAKEIELGTSSTGWKLESLLGSRLSRHDSKIDPLLRIDLKYLAGLCAKYPKRFALYVARVAPLLKQEGGERKWSEIALMLFEKFGMRRDILSEMGANMHSGVWAGPTSQHLQGFIPLLKTLLKHEVAAVRRWAKRQLSGTEKWIGAEVLEEEEWDLRNS